MLPPIGWNGMDVTPPASGERMISVRALSSWKPRIVVSPPAKKRSTLGKTEEPKGKPCS
jgi:hypothetical protein